MTALFPALLSVALIILIGFVAARTLPLEQQTLSKLVIYILSPALIGTSLYHTRISVQSATGLLLGVALTSTVLYLTVQGVSKVLHLKPITRKNLFTTTLLPNTGNMGLPVNDFVYGAAGLERAIVYLIGISLLIFSVTPAVLQGSNIYSGIKLTLKLPLFWAMLAGLLLRLLAVKLPPQIDVSIQQLGKAAIPVALLVLGLYLARHPFKLGIYELLSSGLRLIGAPVIAYGVGRVLHLEELDLQVLVLQSAMPVAVNSVVLVAEFGGDAPLVARTVVVSTILSFFSLPVVIWLS